MELNGRPLAGLEQVRTPALLIDLDAVERNIAATLGLLAQDADRWRPHLKTAKLGLVMRRLRERGVTHAKCATTLELETACEAGFEDVLLAYAVSGPHVATVRRIAARYPHARLSVLVEDPAGLAAWRGAGVACFIDVNAGMHRTGIPLECGQQIAGLARAIGEQGLDFAGLHCYDGHAMEFAPETAREQVHQGYDRIAGLVEELVGLGLRPPEVATAGTPAFPHAASYRGFAALGVRHRVSPGTVVYNDRKSLTQLPASAGYQPAVVVLSSVVSHPGPTRFCCDAGHKSVSADAGIPTCAVLGHPDYLPRHPSEEHLPVDLPAGTPLPRRGEQLVLLPSHVCPTVNNFNEAVVIAGGVIQGVERVTARGRHPPLD